ncbi:zinc ribbon domain-containing protein [Cohnella sp. WQ 127256]|uniref:zinc ribbon domain-containing protein n=1 Tax=Cohnella sp. WQ 127256 TaxID=2938790 RepID=UPI002117E0A1|nr:zinc ribbon domain-containing protein [Cohnella sp. WQ 127256]
MQCTQCGQINQSAKFCVKCGTQLQVAATSETASNNFPPSTSSVPQPPVSHQPLPVQLSKSVEQPAASAQMNPQLQQVKQVSKQYLNYFLEVLKSPMRTGQSSNAGHMVNGLITLILFALILPLMVYFQLRGQVSRIGFGFEDHISFVDVVIKPSFFLFIIVMLVNSIMFLVLKIGNVGVSYREVTARFGSFMIPAVAFFLVSLLFSFISDGSVVMGLLIGLGLFSWLVAVCLVIFSFKKDHTSGMDAFYGVIITYAASIILIALLGEDIASTLFGNLENSFFF